MELVRTVEVDFFDFATHFCVYLMFCAVSVYLLESQVGIGDRCGNRVRFKQHVKVCEAHAFAAEKRQRNLQSALPISTDPSARMLIRELYLMKLTCFSL